MLTIGDNTHINFHQSANSFHLTLVLATFQPITDEDGLFGSSTLSEKGDQECPGHDFLMSLSAVCYVSSKSEA